MQMLSPPSLKMGALSALLSGSGGLQKTQDNHRNHPEKHCFSSIEAWVIPPPWGSSKEVIVIKGKAYLGPSTKSMWLKSKTFAHLHNSGHRFTGEAEVRTGLFWEGGHAVPYPQAHDQRLSLAMKWWTLLVIDRRWMHGMRLGGLGQGTENIIYFIRHK